KGNGPDQGQSKDQQGGKDGQSQDGQGKDGKPVKKKTNPLKNPKVLIIGGIFYWLWARQYVNTDDAFVDPHIVRLAPQVSGQVMRVTVDDNAVVRAGQILVEIDSSTARASLDQAQAQRGQAIAQIAQAQA